MRRVVVDGVKRSGVIWITGYSAAGKTTVGRKVRSQLEKLGLKTVFLDGDDLRSIFGGHWGYERHDRVDLARVYFRLCSSLAAQDLIVVISAVAMYQEISEWFHTNIPRSIQVYLRVPAEERRQRDDRTKKIYQSAGQLEELYDVPTTADMTLDNFGDVTPDAIADQIIDYFLASAPNVSDKGRKEHWRKYYSETRGILQPTPFAMAVAGQIPQRSSLVEIGCGNGRDSVYFASKGHRVTALDVSEEAISNCRRVHNSTSVEFMCSSLPAAVDQLNTVFDLAYGRFVLHAMTLDEELAMLCALGSMIKKGGKLFFECRSINDSLARKGEVISPTERIFGHYRRFIVLDDLISRIEHAGFSIVTSVESKGLAIFGDEDPTVIRVTAERN